MTLVKREAVDENVNPQRDADQAVVEMCLGGPGWQLLPALADEGQGVGLENTEVLDRGSVEVPGEQLLT